ncbi:hypothetical protein K0M31_006166 [Melipona bicolor]|uniref:Uncharacterized protein n=1 Tax=Melipona bicolor TaxID=60889 RepID=A0AA40FTP4_9HYME|nr:hypothetical protein K0M31_006166 [Melipona bicolor]
MIAYLSNNDSAPRGSRLVDQSPGSIITTPPIRKHDQDNANPSSMFTPRRYDFCDNSDMSFCTDNMASLKGTIAPLFFDLGFVLYASILSFIGCISYIQLIKYPHTEDLFEISANVPTYPCRSRTQSRRAMQTLHRPARPTIFHVLMIHLIEGFH